MVNNYPGLKLALRQWTPPRLQESASGNQPGPEYSNPLLRASGEFRIGADRFRRKLRFALDSELTPEEILARAERELVTTTEALYETALPLHEPLFPGAGATRLSDRTTVIRAVLDKLAENAPTDETIVERAKEFTAAATRFTRERDLVTVPDTPLKVIVLPEFQRGVAVAYCEPPGALEAGGETFFKVSPTPANWPRRGRSHSFVNTTNTCCTTSACTRRYLGIICRSPTPTGSRRRRSCARFGGAERSSKVGRSTPTYFVGAIEHDDLRAAAEKRAAAAGEAFDLKKHHDTVLSFGSPPLKSHH